MHYMLLNLIKTSIAENNREWDQTTKFTPYELTFGRNPNVPSALRTSTNLTHKDLIRKWKKKHEDTVRKAKENIQLEMKKTKKRLDENITQKHSIYKIKDKVKIINNTKKNKLEQS